MDDMVICPYCKKEVFVKQEDLLSLVHGYDIVTKCNHCQQYFEASSTTFFQTKELGKHE